MTDNIILSNINKEIKIVVDENHGIKEFGSDTFENLITHFVECDYEEKKKDLEDSIRDKDIIKLKNVLHKIKTLTMYMNCVDLAKLCKEIEFFTQKGHENHETAFSMVPEFLKYFAKLYDEAYKLFRLKYLQITDEVSADKEKSDSKEGVSEDKDLPNNNITENDTLPLDKRSSETSMVLDKIKSAPDVGVVSSAKPSLVSKENVLDFNSNKRNQNFINIESGSFTNTQFTFGSDETNLEKYENDIFRVDTVLTIDKKEIDEEFKETLKIFIEIEAPKLSVSISDAIESDNKEQLLDLIKKLKSAAAICFFNSFVQKLEDWCKLISKKQSVKELSKYTEKIQSIINKMIDEAKHVLNGISYSNQTKNYMLLVSQPKISQTNTSPGFKKLSDNKSTIIGIHQPTSLNNYLISRGNEEDNILMDLKPLKFDGLFRKDISEEEMTEEIKKISQSSSKEQNTTQNKSRINKQIKKPINDCSYPFKQETFKLNCLII